MQQANYPVQLPDLSFLNPNDPNIVHQIAHVLNESEAELIWRMINTLGLEYCINLVFRVRDIQASGGVLNAKGTRYRTPGGLYFYIAKKEVNSDIAKHIFQEHSVQKRKQHKENSKLKKSALQQPCIF